MELFIIPLHYIYLSSDFVNGPVAVGIRETLSFKGVHLLSGNDLKVVVNQFVTGSFILLSRNSFIFIHYVRLLEPWQRKLF